MSGFGVGSSHDSKEGMLDSDFELLRANKSLFQVVTWAWRVRVKKLQTAYLKM